MAEALRHTLEQCLAPKRIHRWKSHGFPRSFVIAVAIQLRPAEQHIRRPENPGLEEINQVQLLAAINSFPFSTTYTNPEKNTGRHVRVSVREITCTTYNLFTIYESSSTSVISVTS